MVDTFDRGYRIRSSRSSSNKLLNNVEIFNPDGKLIAITFEGGGSDPNRITNIINNDIAANNQVTEKEEKPMINSERKDSPIITQNSIPQLSTNQKLALAAGALLVVL